LKGKDVKKTERIVVLRVLSYEFIGLLGQISKTSPFNNHVKPTSMSDKPRFVILKQTTNLELEK
jgi:hypothetical protein